MTGDPKMTLKTQRLVVLAEDGGLRPDVDAATRRGLYRILLNGTGRDGLFGAIYVSARTGRVVRALLTHGNWGQEKTYTGYREVRPVLVSWLALQRSTPRGRRSR